VTTIAGGLCSLALAVIWIISDGVGKPRLSREGLLCVGDGSCNVSAVLLRSLVTVCVEAARRIDGSRLRSRLVHSLVIWFNPGLRFSSPGRLGYAIARPRRKPASS
jgi:hypothetical protein